MNPPNVGGASLGGPDTTQVLAKMFMGRTTTQPAMGYAPLRGSVVQIVGSQVQVVIDNFSYSPPGSAQLPTPTFTCDYEPRYLPPSGVAITPPVGTACLVAFPPVQNSVTPWVIAFLGWPS